MIFDRQNNCVVNKECYPSIYDEFIVDCFFRRILYLLALNHQFHLCYMLETQLQT